jgi:DNA sulfur modification protein DndD
MRFVSMTLKNWRSFHGENAIEFSVDPDQPITLILGPNGAGKTALLNAFTWAIYGEFTEGFDRRNDLINHEALAVNASEVAQVKLVLSDAGKEFTITRSATAAQQEAGTYDVFVSVDGSTDLEESIHHLLPKALKDLFFFPAETFGTAKVLRSRDRQHESSTLEIDTAIRTLLGGDVYDNAIRDLRTAENSGSLRSTRKVSDDAIGQANEAWGKAQAELAEAERLKEVLPAELTSARAEAERAQKTAEQYDPAKIAQWQQEFARRSAEVATAKAEVDRANDIYVQLARGAYRHFVAKAVPAAIRRLDAAEACGLIPPRIDGQVLQRTLDEGRCLLCGEELSDHATHRVKELQLRVADSTTALRGLEARGDLKNFVERSGETLAQLRASVSDLASRFENVASPSKDADLVHLRATVHECIALADRLHRRAESSLEEFKAAEQPEQPTTNVVQIAVARQLAVRGLEERIAALPRRIKELQTARDAALADLTAKSKGSKEAIDKTEAIRLLDDSKAFFQAARDGLTEYGRVDFERAINQTYKDLVRKPYELRVDANFRISLFNEGSEQQVAASQAENVLLLIAFLGAIARLAPQYQQIASEKAQLKKVGDVITSAAEGFPVVIDAPTSALDDQYESEVVQALPRLLPQIVIPVSAKSVDRWEEIVPAIGRVYIMELTSKGQSDRTVRWGGKDRAYSRSDDSVTTRTRIVEVI